MNWYKEYPLEGKFVYIGKEDKDFIYSKVYYGKTYSGNLHFIGYEFVNEFNEISYFEQGSLERYFELLSERRIRIINEIS